MITSLLNSVIHSTAAKRIALESGALEEIARPYIGGHTAQQAKATALGLRRKGLLVGFSYLPATDEEPNSFGVLEELLDVLGEDAEGVEMSVKPSQLRIDAHGAEGRLQRFTERAEAQGALVTLEMQGSVRYEATLQAWEQVRAQHPNLGITLPVEIKRAEQDCLRIIQEGSPRMRLCVGAYPVRKGQALRREHDKSLALARCLRASVDAGARTMLASHDPRIIAIAQELQRRHPQSEIEFQMYHGVRPLEQRRLTDIGLRSRVLLPFGPAGFEYLLTRVAARPGTALGYLRAITDKR